MSGDEMLREAEAILRASGIKNSLQQLRSHLMEDIALTASHMYDELLSSGMPEDMARDITKTYVVDFCRAESWVETEAMYDEYWDDEW